MPSDWPALERVLSSQKYEIKFRTKFFVYENFFFNSIVGGGGGGRRGGHDSLTSGKKKGKRMIRPNKKRSLLRLTWLKFLRAGSRFLFLLKFFYVYTQIKSGMPTSTFQKQGTVTLVPVASPPEECRCQSRPGRAYVLDGWQRWCDELESAVSSFFGSSSAWSLSTMMWKKTWHRSYPASSGLWSEA